jgi:beta-N-acetylhexosaminidase
MKLIFRRIPSFFNSILLILLLNLCAFGQLKAQSNSFVEFIYQSHPWVDSVFKTLTPREKVAQLFMVRAHTNLGQRYIDSVAQVISKEQLGGLVLFQGGPVRHAQMIQRYQQLSKVPLLVALDGEWGLGMRMPDSTLSYPYQMTLGAIQNEALLYQMGREIAKDFKLMGMHINFAPVVDINNNPRNPVINFRSFGEDPQNVTRKGLAYMKGMMDEGILISLKHFPGHGDTDVDSHYDLPLLPFSAGRLDSLEMFPFKTLINEGASGLMVAHMQIPSLDPTPNLPSSLSKPIVTGLLKEKLGFKGLIFTDAMDMHGVVKHFRNGEADVRALIAGNDIIELSQNSDRSIRMVLQAIAQGRISQTEIDQRVKKVLAAKFWMMQSQNQLVTPAQLPSLLNRSSSRLLIQRLSEASITLLGKEEVLRQLDPSKKTAIVSVGTKEITPFQQDVALRYNQHLHYLVSNDATADEVVAVLNELNGYDQVIVALHDNRARPRSELPYNTAIKLFVSELSSRNVVFCLFGNPYALAGLPGIEKASSIVVAYQNDLFMQRAVAKVFTRKLRPSGRLPVSINAYFKAGDGR